ncbi:GNAT family N-acetyltransferase [Nocardiopsis metallicus]|uniref:GNAT family N-acetyltransferase n=1 Tax=Nocardiopsis metallicus TaxID=179819 RepID=UPI00161D2F39|nr:GNAT family N-acetyltransferase [Nocardiopsis metallicus]
MAAVTNLEIRPYRPSDEDRWLRCRVLSFLYTPYYDDVKTTKTEFEGPGVELVAVSDGTVVGVLDAELCGEEATIDTIAVHPDHQGRGIGTALLEALLVPLREAGVRTLDAYTRDQPEVLGWYRAMGFTEQDHYVHVHADGAEAAGAAAPLVGFHVGKAFLHADLCEEAELREKFGRVYVCRRFVRPVNL